MCGTWKPWRLGAWLWAVTGMVLAVGHAEIDDQTRLALETLSRLKDTDLGTNAGLKAAVLKVLEKTRGQPEFVDLVRDFRLPGHEAELLRVAALHPQAPQAVEAVRLVLASPTGDALIQALNSDSGPILTEIVGRSGDPRGVSFLRPLLDQPAQQKAAALALTQTSEGATQLIAAQKAGTLNPALIGIVGPALRTAPWPQIRSAADLTFPSLSLTAPGSGEFPPVTELLLMRGNAQNGAAVFRRPEVACHTCHQVNGDGTDFGPKLSEIGSKLGQDALIAAILEPSAGISFGFEAWRLELKNGDEVFGLIVSDAEDELVVKQQGGQTVSIKKSDVATREKQTLSVMPAGLHQSLTTQEFVDLIAYLSSLKKVE